MSHEVEIERTYLAASIPIEIKDVTPVRIEDTYIPEKHNFSPLRLRSQNKKFELTRKMPVREGDFSSHDEHTIPLEEDVFQDIKRLSSKSVTKDRYSVSIMGIPAQADVFRGELEGLVLIEFEFKDEEAMNSFRVPSCCLADVTQENTIRGGQLAGKKYDDIAGWLSEFNYRKLV